MNLRKDVLHRLLLAKSILSAGRGSIGAQPNAHVVAIQVLNAHDAADLVFAAIASNQNTLPPTSKAPSMLQCLDCIVISADRHASYFRQLNDARNGLKHAGNLPNTNQWANVTGEVFEKLSGICEVTLGVLLGDLDESELLSSDEARAHVASAKHARALRDFKLALEAIGKALFVSLESAPEGVGRGIIVGRAKAEDALKLTALGVSANDFLRLQEFLPMVSASPWGPDQQSQIEGVQWKQSEFGHPGNWRADVVDFCMSSYLNVALSMQNAASLPHAVEFSHFYEYKVTAKKDRVEVWEDFVEDPLAHVYADNGRPFRTHKRFLKSGEAVAVSGYIRPLLSEDFSLSGERIQRVRLTYDNMSAMLPSPHDRAEFVNRVDVDITCSPVTWIQELYPNLPEIPWEEDPLAFSL